MGRGAEQHLAADPQRRQTGQSHPFPNTHAQGEPYGAKYTSSALLTPHDVEEPAFFLPRFHTTSREVRKSLCSALVQRKPFCHSRFI